MSSPWIFAARRLAHELPLLLGMSILVFGLVRLVPGDPAVVVLGYKATPEGVRALREAFHLDEPVPQQYLRWLAGVLRGDFGLDFRQNEPIGRMILERLPVTLELTLLATLCTALIGIPLGLVGGARRHGFADRATLAIGLVGVSIPDFWLGIMLMLGLSLGAGLLPSGGFVPLGEAPLDNLRHLVLPALTLALSRAAVLGRLSRPAVLPLGSPTDIAKDLALRGPTVAEPFGMDDLGRSILSRVVYAYRISLGVAVTSAVLAVLIGVPLGLVAGYCEGLADQLIMRPLDVLMAFPAVLLAIALMSVFGTGAVLLSVALAIVYTPVMARVARAAVLATKVEVYVDGARALGATMPRLVLNHIAPNAATPMLVQTSLLMAIGILI